MDWIMGGRNDLIEEKYLGPEIQCKFYIILELRASLVRCLVRVV